MKDDVYLKAVASYDTELVTRAVEELFGGCTVAMGPSTKVLLKPNLLSKSSPEKAITTHPEVVRGVIRACRQRGVENIVIADSAGGLYNPKQCQALYQGTGMAKIAQEEKVSLYTDCQWVEVPCEGKVVSSFPIIKIATEVDVIINLPKFKTHVMTGMTAGVKNMFGCVPGLEKSQWHTRFPQREDFGEMLVDLHQLLPPSFHVLDGILAMEGDGPGGGEPRQSGILLSSENALHLDLVVAEMMGYTGRDIPYLSAAMNRGLCGERVDTAWIQGDRALFEPIPNWVLPKSYQGVVTADTTFSQFLPKPLQGFGRLLEKQMAARPVVRGELCINCQKCSEICSKNAIDFVKDKAVIRKKDCISCFCCHEVCPVKAIDVKKSRIYNQ